MKLRMQMAVQMKKWLKSIGEIILPLPSTTIRTMAVTVVSTDGITLPSAITVTVPERGTLKDLIGALTASCSLREDETLLVAEIYKNRIFRVLEDPSDSLADIRDQDKLVAYRVRKYNEDSLLIVFMHERLVESYRRERFENRLFGIPVVARLSDITSGYDVRKEFLNLINPFLIQNTEEPLGPEDMWYCPTCKKPLQATKMLDLWRLPKILVVHLKRFSYNRFFKNKLETFVDFPINDLDLSTYVAHRSCPSPYSYMLYAIICHYGGLGGGHYTAVVRYGHDKWYEFDDSRVAHAEEETTIKTPAAYVLFYKKI